MIKKLILLLLAALLVACEQAPSEAVPQTTAVSDGPSLPDGVSARFRSSWRVGRVSRIEAIR